jgi:hypothetical protein
MHLQQAIIRVPSTNLQGLIKSCFFGLQEVLVTRLRFLSSRLEMTISDDTRMSIPIPTIVLLNPLSSGTWEI